MKGRERYFYLYNLTNITLGPTVKLRSVCTKRLIATKSPYITLRVYMMMKYTTFQTQEETSVASCLSKPGLKRTAAVIQALQPVCVETTHLNGKRRK